MMEQKLLLGAGLDHWDEFITLDADPLTLPDITATIPPLPEDVIAHGWDQIAAIHFIEHLRLEEARALLRDCYAALRPGGVLVLEQPNIAQCMRVFLGLVPVPEEQFERFGIQGIFGEQNGSPWMVHRWGYTPDSLIVELRAAGFDHIERVGVRHHHIERDFRLEAFK